MIPHCRCWLLVCTFAALTASGAPPSSIKERSAAIVTVVPSFIYRSHASIRSSVATASPAISSFHGGTVAVAPAVNALRSDASVASSRPGFFGAVASSIIALGLQALLIGLASRRFYAIPYETGRLVRFFLLAALWYGIAVAVPLRSLAASVAVKLALLAAFPLVLVAVGVVTRAEVSRLRSFVARAAGAGRPETAPGEIGQVP